MSILKKTTANIFNGEQLLIEVIPPNSGPRMFPLPLPFNIIPDILGNEIGQETKIKDEYWEERNKIVFTNGMIVYVKNTEKSSSSTRTNM